MPKLPVISGKEVVKALTKKDWYIDRRAKSRHIIMKKEGFNITLSIPDHKILDRGLLRAIIRDSGMTVKEFINLL